LRVIKIDPERRRIGLSLRKVDSPAYADLDWKMELAGEVEKVAGNEPSLEETEVSFVSAEYEEHEVAGEPEESFVPEVPEAVEESPAEQSRRGNLEEVEGIGPVYAAKLNEIGIITTDQLLEAGATPAGRDDLAEKSGISGKLILTWVNHCDLFRINGVGPQYAELLEAAGIDTVVELAQRNGENLHAKLAEVNEEKNLVNRLPDLESVEEWIGQAKELPRAVNY